MNVAVKTRLTGFAAGSGAGFVLAWARVSDPAVVRDMLLLRDAHLFLVMGSAVVVAAIGARMLRAAAGRSLLTRERIGWTVERPQSRHVGGSALFGIGWCVAGTCPGPLAAMIGEGRLGGLTVVAGLMAGITLRGVITRKRAPAASATTPVAATP